MHAHSNNMRNQFEQEQMNIQNLIRTYNAEDSLSSDAIFNESSSNPASHNASMSVNEHLNTELEVVPANIFQVVVGQ